MEVGVFAKIEFGYGIESISMGTRVQRPGYTNGWDLYSYDANGVWMRSWVAATTMRYDMLDFFVRRRCWMLSAPPSPVWIVAVYLPARIVAVWG